MGLVSHCQAAKLLVGRYAQEARLAKLLPHVVGELILLVGAGGDFFGYLAAGEVADRVAQFIEVGLCGWCEVFGVLC